MIQINDLTVTDVNHKLPPKYEEWGRGGNTQLLQLKPLHDKQIIDVQIRENFGFLNLEGLQLERAGEVNLYQGEEIEPRACLYARYQKAPALNNGEHVSVLLDAKTGQLLGLTQMLPSFKKQNLPHPQDAMNIAVKFLSQYAQDLVSNAETFGFTKAVPADARVMFDQPIDFEKVSFQWVGMHDETIQVDGKDIVVTGFKVKMYIPELKLWSWVIVGNDGQIITFERNVCWDFENARRLTGMWLHSHWLMSV